MCATWIWEIKDELFHDIIFGVICFFGPDFVCE